MFRHLKPLIVRGAKEMLKSRRQAHKASFGRSVRPFSMADFIAGGNFALELIEKEMKKDAGKP